MPRLIVTTRYDGEKIIEGPSGMSIKDVVLNAGLDEILALCGGSCACGTCQIYIDPAMIASLGPVGKDENELLDASPHYRPNSRLACQVIFSDALDGLRITIAPED